MSEIKYIVVCKNGYLFTPSLEVVKEFVEQNGRDIAYYIGYFNPIENLDFLNPINSNILDLGDLYDNRTKRI